MTAVWDGGIFSRFFCILVFASRAYAAGTTAPAQFFDLGAVRLSPGPFQRAAALNARYLLSLESDRFLHYFRIEAGIEAKAPPYGGWESPTTGAGRCLGHYLSALSLQFRATGDTQFKDRIDYIVSELAACQKANGGGYLCAQTHGKEFWPDLAVGNPDALKKHRVPWYIAHKMFAGLRDAYQLAGNEQAKDVLLQFADWAIGVTRKLDDAGFQRMLDQEYGGMREVLADVAEISGDKKYLDLANRFRQPGIEDPLADHRDQLNGLHANTQIPKLIGSARVYEITGDARDRQAAEYFWAEVVNHHTYAIGGNSRDEHFHKPDQLASQLSVTTAETCNTYNMLKLTRHLFAWEPKVAYMDYCERALYNDILASQDPREGMFTYFMSLQPGHFKTFSTPTDSFWCCVGTGMENHTKYGESIYFHDDRSLYVNLFISSELTWREKGLKLTQETRYPENGHAKLTFSCAAPVRLALRIRYPSWAADGLKVFVNEKSENVVARPGSYFTVDREWKQADVLSFNIPLGLRMEPTPDDPKRVAIFFGPLVLGGRLGTEGMKSPMPYAKSQMDYAKVADVPVPKLATQGRPVAEWLGPVADQPLTFRMQGVTQPADVTLIPFYLQDRERYTIYWDVDR